MTEACADRGVMRFSATYLFASHCKLFLQEIDLHLKLGDQLRLKVIFDTKLLHHFALKDLLFIMVILRIFYN
jgi:hypothetical protein